MSSKTAKRASRIIIRQPIRVDPRRIRDGKVRAVAGADAQDSHRRAPKAGPATFCSTPSMFFCGCSVTLFDVTEGSRLPSPLVFGASRKLDRKRTLDLRGSKYFIRQLGPAWRRIRAALLVLFFWGCPYFLRLVVASKRAALRYVR